MKMAGLNTIATKRAPLSLLYPIISGSAEPPTLRSTRRCSASMAVWLVPVEGLFSGRRRSITPSHGPRLMALRPTRQIGIGRSFGIIVPSVKKYRPFAGPVPVETQPIPIRGGHGR